VTQTRADRHRPSNVGGFYLDIIDIDIDIIAIETTETFLGPFVPRCRGRD
jgi:hypothetical protein|tara:strand:+ start:346 stop:495 length:150 start_codon:yes stop_codon:yes gene_type:complete